MEPFLLGEFDFGNLLDETCCKAQKEQAVLRIQLMKVYCRERVFLFIQIDLVQQNRGYLAYGVDPSW